MDWVIANALGIVEIAWINILLSGDNAVVIALASRSLPARQRKLGIIFGAGAAILLRIVFALIVTQLMEMSYLKLLGGLLLLWIAVRLAVGEDEDERTVKGHDRLWRAVLTIALADATMSLDNVIAVAAISGGQTWLFVLGLVLSIPLIVIGSTLIMTLMERWPIIVWGGAALLGWVAGEMVASDPALEPQLAFTPAGLEHYAFAAIGALLVIGLAYMLRQRREERGA